MQTYHGEAIVNKEGNIIVALPFRIGEKVEIVVIPSGDNSEESSWKELAEREFLKGYSEEDAAYDNYNA